MNRAGLLSVLAIAAVVGLLFGFYPQLDVKISGLFFDQAAREFPPPSGVTIFLRDAAMWIVAAVSGPAFIAVAFKLVAPKKPMLIPGRAALLMIATLAIAPGFMTNVVLKDHWGRGRPAFVHEFGGAEQFLPWWDFRGECRDNCSFVAGEPSGAFWTLAPAALTPAPWRPLAYSAAVLFGSSVGLLRIAKGGHFFTDVVFAAVMNFIILWIAHGLIYRWRRTRTTDAAIEHLLARISAPFRRRSEKGGRAKRKRRT
jgi:membrane-associated phospholipid phosphatase